MQSKEVEGTTYSPALRQAIERELERLGLSEAERTPENILSAIERIYATQGEAPFDPLNPADMLARAFVLAEANVQ